MVAAPQAVAELLARVMQACYRSSSPELVRLLGELALSFTQVKTLHLLREAGDVHVTDVADSLGMSLPAVSRSVDGLVQRGFVERKESEKDRRAKLVRLLPAGRATIDDIDRARLAAMEDVMAILSDEERAGLHDALLPIVERISTP
jgi:DNA-binding MarR family transcriptional regulator